jgi:peptidoglycan/LPS O-acetylase OafA/YrhL
MDVKNVGTGRLGYLDGLRGWMALAVVFAHLFQIWLLSDAQLKRFDVEWISRAIPHAIHWTPLGAMMDGLQAVFVFFVISGLAITYPILRSAQPSLTTFRMALYRYPRLMVPVLASSLLSYALLANGAYFNAAAAAYHADAAWYASLLRMPADFGEMLKSALWDTFFDSPITARSWNPVLWTMQIELNGSFMLFVLVGLGRWRWLRMTVALGLVAFLWTGERGGYYCGFLVGYFLAELLVAGERSERVRRGLAAATPLGWACTIGAVLLSTWLQGASLGASRTNYLPHMNVIAALAVAGAMLTGPVRAFLCNRLSQFLGRISFSLYLTHLLVICSFASALFIAVQAWPYAMVVLVVGGLTFIVAIATAVCFTVIVEETLLPQVKRVLLAAVSGSARRTAGRLATTAGSGRD